MALLLLLLLVRFDWLQIKLADEVRAFNLHGHGVELEPIGLLSINQETGEVTVNRAADYEKYPVLKVWGKFLPNARRLFFCCLLSILIIYMYSFQLTFEAMFKETKLVDTRLGVEVRIKDANDNPPTFKPQTVEVTILESTKQGKEIVPLFSSTPFSLHMQLLRRLSWNTHVNYLRTDRDEPGLTYGERQGRGHQQQQQVWLENAFSHTKTARPGVLLGTEGRNWNNFI